MYTLMIILQHKPTPKQLNVKQTDHRKTLQQIITNEYNLQRFMHPLRLTVSCRRHGTIFTQQIHRIISLMC